MSYDKFEFVSIDFEHATPFKGSICSAGIVTFSQGQIIDEFYTLIRPPKNEYAPYNIAKHKITPEKTLESQSFSFVYGEIRRRVYQKKVVAHGAFHTDKHCLEQAMKYENILEDLEIQWICTQSIFETSLDVLCKGCSIELDHHHALSDAKACGFVYDAYLREKIDFNKIEFAKLDDSVKRESLKPVYPAKLSGDILKPNFGDTYNSNTPFFMKKVVISGFNDSTKNSLSKELYELGADIDGTVGKSTNYLIIGDSPGPSKIQKMQQNIDAGRDAKIITIEEYKIISGSI